jgi:uncharacterized protein DUF5658
MVCGPAGAWLIAPALPASRPAADVTAVSPGPAPAAVSPTLGPKPPKRPAVRNARERAPRASVASPPPAPAAPIVVPIPEPEVPAPPPAADAPEPPLDFLFRSAAPLPLVASSVLPLRRTVTERSPRVLVPLYVSYGALQALDFHSTRAALKSGKGREANPLLKGVAHSSAGLIAVKAASTAVVIYGTGKLWKKNRAAAVLVLVGVNSATAIVVARNYRVR